MSFVSYSQNFEDVLLWRVFRHIEAGTYLDIGAQDPVLDSVSLAFYKAGWRGIHVEPTPAYAAMLRQDRPDETVIEAAVTDAPGVMTFYEVPETGLSTGDADIADRHGKIGFEVCPIVVPTVRLDDLLDLAGDDVHWMKIDVEGMEASVLRSWGESPRRPWVLVIESTLPNSQTPTFELWIDEVVKRGYREVHFDGLSRYFLSEHHAELAEHFAAPPNVFDGFQISPAHFTIKELMRGVDDERSEADRRTVELQSELAAASDLLANAKANIDAVEAARSAAHERASTLHEQFAALASAADKARSDQLASIEALEARLVRLASVADQAKADQLAAFEELAQSRHEQALALDRAWRERHAFEVDLRQQWTTKEEQFRQSDADRAAVMREAGAQIGALQESISRQARENEQLRNAMDRLEQKGAEANSWIAQILTTTSAIETLVKAANARPPGVWQRLGQAFGISPKTDGHEPATQPPPEPVEATIKHLERDPHLPTHDSTRNPYLRANSLEELLAWQDFDFVRCAYVTLLGRQPDPEGEAYYTYRVRSVASKMEVLWQLRRSAEGKRHDPGIAGFDRALKRAARARNPFLAWAMKDVTGGDREGLQRIMAESRRASAEEARRVSAPAAIPVAPDKVEALAAPVAATVFRPARPLVQPTASALTLSDISIFSSPVAARTKGIVYSVGHTSGCPVNTGVQRVARQLARALVDSGETLVFVKWNDEARAFELLNRDELKHFGKWSGPRSRDVFNLSQYPDKGAKPAFLTDLNWLAADWMVFPEVHHLGTEDREITINQVNAARALDLKTAAVFYDAIPLRRPELKGMGELHEAYMRQLMEIDVIFPISHAASQDLELFLQSYEGVERERMPAIRPALLPAEIPAKTRRKAGGEHNKTVLCVGSIDERKNQLLLAEAFADLSGEENLAGWKLLLVGNCSPVVHPLLSEIMTRCPAIEWLGPISDEALGELYNGAAFCAFPSVDEGFGLPIAESLWMGKPCLCANFGSMAEIAEAGGCLTVDTADLASLKNGLKRLMLDAKLLARLQGEVGSAVLTTWSDYAAGLRSEMDKTAHGAGLLGPMYYVAEQTALHPGNSGIQRVTRALARALLDIGVPLIAAKWNSTKSGLCPLNAKELEHVARFNGPLPGSWSAWQEPGEAAKVGWILMPELTPHFEPSDYDAMRSFMDGNGLRGSWVFHDTIPWKMQEFYSDGAATAHSNYMIGLNKFHLILANSEYSRTELEKFYLSVREPTVDLAHRLSACVLPGEFKERVRATKPALRNDGPLLILSVGTLEARKNHLTLVKAFVKARPLFEREVKLVLAGNAPFPEVFDPINELMAGSSDIEWVDRPNDAALDRLYKECDFTAYPSIEEGFGLPIVESIWYAKPCISADFGAMREAAQGGGCLLVDTRNVDALASALVRLANSDPLRAALAEEACTRPVKDWTDYAKEIVAKLIEDTPPPAAVVTARKSERNSDAWQRAFPNLKPRPLLSICITTYNRAMWLERSLRALLEACSGLGEQVEIVVCDNTSPDDTPEVMRKYADNDMVRYYRNARNVGMLGNLLVTSQNARGEYMWIIGDDDLVMPQSVRNILDALRQNPRTSLVYTNYAFTREEDPEKANNLAEFFATSTPIADGGDDFVGLTKDVAVRNENFFTAIYSIVFRRDHGVRAYGQYTEGEPFSSLLTCVPTTNYVLKNIMNDEAVWLAEPQIVVNLNVSWMKYAWRWILERFPQIHDTAVRYGADPRQVDRWRDHHLPSMVHFLSDAYGATEGGRSDFDLRNLILDVKHLDRYPEFREDLKRIYAAAFESGHPAAKFDPGEVFAV